jgi:2-iminobutanoate/2-iminopropanoate deaminase
MRTRASRDDCSALQSITFSSRTMTDDVRRWTPVTLGNDVLPPVGPYSPAVRAGDFVFVSGQVPRDPRTGVLVGQTVEEQARQTLSNLRRALEAAGASTTDVVSVTVYLADENDWAAFNSIYTSVFSPPYPTRTAVGAKLRGVLVEISAVAWLGRATQR